MIIFARSPFRDFGYFSTGNEVNPIVGTFSNQYRVRTIVNWIFHSYLMRPDDIDCLYLCAHGNAGMLALGDWVDKDSAKEFSALQGTFSENSRGIELHGCACASATDITEWDGTGTPATSGKGYEFMRELARNAGVKVTGPIDGVWGTNAAYSYQGVRTMTVLPGGSAYFNYGLNLR